MKKLVVCFDGTWNTLGNTDEGVPAPTNVADLEKYIKSGPSVKTFYIAGVGTSGGKLKRLYEGSTGAGLTKDLGQGYRWLAENYQPGDKIYFFGFSRGSYTARSLAGMIGSVGLMDLTGSSLSKNERKRAVNSAMDAYKGNKKKLSRNQEVGAIAPVKKKYLEYLRGTGAVPIQFLGVWDTVGALGIPDDFGFWKFAFGNLARYKFHDTRLGEIVKNACHAVAIDERRVDFRPTLWTDIDAHAGQNIEQVWFTGVHGDIGGSYADTDLGDLTLKWMMQAAKKAGLAFKPGVLTALKGKPDGKLHNSIRNVFKKRPTIPRNVPNLATAGPDLVSASVGLRRAKLSDYWATTTLDVGQTSDWITIAAEQHWARTGIYLEAGGTYEFTAEGEWMDASLEATPAGNKKGIRWGKAAQKAADALGGFLSLIRRLPDAEKGKSKLVRRYEKAPWFSLIGVVANGDEIAKWKQKAVLYEKFKIGLNAQKAINRSGYLFCYANDAWAFYKNNSGAIKLKVSRIG